MTETQVGPSEGAHLPASNATVSHYGDIDRHRRHAAALDRYLNPEKGVRTTHTLTIADPYRDAHADRGLEELQAIAERWANEYRARWSA